MTDPEKIAFKSRLKQAAADLITRRIDAAKMAIDEAQQAANQEEKSSAGDKYETGRAMGHLQKEMLGRQMAEQLKELGALQGSPVNTVYSAVTNGAFIRCTEVSFFIAAGLGKQSVEGQIIFFLSPQAPLSKALDGKKMNENICFNGKNMLIEEVY